jgi:hypothetical protein
VLKDAQDMQKAEETFLPDPKFLETFGRGPFKTLGDRSLGAGYRAATLGVPRNRAALAGLLLIKRMSGHKIV